MSHLMQSLVEGSIISGFCAPAFLRDIARERELDIDQYQLAAIAGWSEDQGTDDEQTLIAVAAMGLCGTWQQLTIDIMQQMLDSQITCYLVVNWMAQEEPGELNVNQNHYSRFMGATRVELFLRESLYGGSKLTLRRDYFEPRWHDIPDSDDFADLKSENYNWALVMAENERDLSALLSLAGIVLKHESSSALDYLQRALEAVG